MKNPQNFSHVEKPIPHFSHRKPAHINDNLTIQRSITTIPQKIPNNHHTVTWPGHRHVTARPAHAAARSVCRLSEILFKTAIPTCVGPHTPTAHPQYHCEPHTYHPADPHGHSRRPTHANVRPQKSPD